MNSSHNFQFKSMTKTEEHKRTRSNFFSNGKHNDQVVWQDERYQVLKGQQLEKETSEFPCRNTIHSSLRHLSLQWDHHLLVLNTTTSLRNSFPILNSLIKINLQRLLKKEESLRVNIMELLLLSLSIGRSFFWRVQSRELCQLKHLFNNIKIQ